jgi:WD40 repeat protein
VAEELASFVMHVDDQQLRDAQEPLGAFDKSRATLTPVSPSQLEGFGAASASNTDTNDALTEDNIRHQRQTTTSPTTQDVRSEALLPKEVTPPVSEAHAVVFGAACNWYCSQVMDLHADANLAIFGAKDAVHLLLLTSDAASTDASSPSKAISSSKTVNGTPDGGHEFNEISPLGDENTSASQSRELRSPLARLAPMRSAAMAAKLPRIVDTLVGHKRGSRVTAVHFCKSTALQRFCASGASDGTVILWDIAKTNSDHSGKPHFHRKKQKQQHECRVASHSQHGTKTEVTALTITAGASPIVVSADSNGKLVLWRPGEMGMHANAGVVSTKDGEDVQADNNSHGNNVNGVFRSCKPMSGAGARIECLDVACESREKHHMAAVGYRGGNILLINTDTLEVQHRLFGHDESVHCLRFHPGYPQLLASSSHDRTMGLWDTGSGDQLGTLQLPLAVDKRRGSASHAQQQRFWFAFDWVLDDDDDNDVDVVDEGNADDPVSLYESAVQSTSSTDNWRSPKSNNTQGISRRQNDRVGTVVNLISSSISGDLLSWRLQVSMPSSTSTSTSSPVHSQEQQLSSSANHSAGNVGSVRVLGAPLAFAQGHSRTVFTLRVSAKSRNTVISAGMDRVLHIWDLRRLRQECPPVQGLGGHAHALHVNPTLPGSSRTTRVAIGVGDQSVRVWTTNDRSDPFKSLFLWRGLKSKVTVVRWHPLANVGSSDITELIAYGTEDGCVGLLPLYGAQHTRFKASHSGPVVALQWRSVCTNAKDDPTSKRWMLYSGDAKQVFEHDPNAPSCKAKFCDIAPILAEADPKSARMFNVLTTFAWCAAMSGRLDDAVVGGETRDVLAVGTGVGPIALFICKSRKLRGCDTSDGLLLVRILQQDGSPSASASLQWGLDNACDWLQGHAKVRQDDANSNNSCCSMWLASTPNKGSSVASVTVFKISCLQAPASDAVVVGEQEPHNNKDVSLLTNGHVPVMTLMGPKCTKAGVYVAAMAWNTGDVLRSCCNSCGGGERMMGGESNVVVRLAAACTDGNAFVWNAVNGALLVVCGYGGHIGHVRCLIWIPTSNLRHDEVDKNETDNCNMLVTGGADQTVRVWNTSAFQLVQTGRDVESAVAVSTSSTPPTTSPKQMHDDEAVVVDASSPTTASQGQWQQRGSKSVHASVAGMFTVAKGPMENASWVRTRGIELGMTDANTVSDSSSSHIQVEKKKKKKQKNPDGGGHDCQLGVISPQLRPNQPMEDEARLRLARYSVVIQRLVRTAHRRATDDFSTLTPRFLLGLDGDGNASPGEAAVDKVLSGLSSSFGISASMKTRAALVGANIDATAPTANSTTPMSEILGSWLDAIGGHTSNLSMLAQESRRYSQQQEPQQGAQHHYNSAIDEGVRRLSQSVSPGAHVLAAMWGGDTVGALRAAQLAGTLTADLVAMAPAVGIDVWAWAAKAYADQLLLLNNTSGISSIEKERNTFDAAAMLVAVGQVHEAIKVLAYTSSGRTESGVVGRFVYDALALAHARLGASLHRHHHHENNEDGPSWPQWRS